VHKFPVSSQKFPVPLSREFGSKSPKIIGRMRSSETQAGSNLKNSLFFSLLAGNLDAETGSTVTASATKFTVSVPFVYDCSRSVQVYHWPIIGHGHYGKTLGLVFFPGLVTVMD
jgi:hypothetical protein